jgi:hypothetical protein
VVADLNGDGSPDLVTTNAGDGSVSVLLGNGNGTFGNPTSFGAWDSPQSVAVADFDGNGKLDLVTANSSDTVSVLPGKGNGGFGIPDLITIGSHPASLATGDFIGDGWTDLGTANTNSNNVSVLINTGYWPSLLVTATDPVTGATITSTTAGTPFHLTATAQDPTGNVLISFTDQVSFRSWDAQATIIDPATGSMVALQTFTNTFTAADHGTHTFTVYLKTAGTQSITFSDPTAGVTVPGAGITVNPAAATTFQVSGFPSPIFASDSSTFTVTALCMNWPGPATSCGSSTPASRACVHCTPTTVSCRVGDRPSSPLWPARTAATSTAWPWWTAGRAMSRRSARPTHPRAGGRPSRAAAS